MFASATAFLRAHAAALRAHPRAKLAFFWQFLAKKNRGISILIFKTFDCASHNHGWKMLPIGRLLWSQDQKKWAVEPVPR